MKMSGDEWGSGEREGWRVEREGGREGDGLDEGGPDEDGLNRMDSTGRTQDHGRTAYTHI